MLIINTCYAGKEHKENNTIRRDEYVAFNSIGANKLFRTASLVSDHIQYHTWISSNGKTCFSKTDAETVNNDRHSVKIPEIIKSNIKHRMVYIYYQTFSTQI